jgi:acetyl esterase
VRNSSAAVPGSSASGFSQTTWRPPASSRRVSSEWLAGFDPLFDEGHAYALRLREAGTAVALAVHRQVHAFAELTRASPSARAALAGACHWLTPGIS